VSVDSTINRAPSARDGPSPRHRGLSSYENLRVEPADHGIGRSSGGLSTRIHQLVDGRGRPVCYDVDNYNGRNVIERGFNDTKQWRGLTSRYDTSPLPIAAEPSCEPSHSG
jgi:hypothetical protein